MAHSSNYPKCPYKHDDVVHAAGSRTPNVSRERKQSKSRQQSADVSREQEVETSEQEKVKQQAQQAGRQESRSSFGDHLPSLTGHQKHPVATYDRRRNPGDFTGIADIRKDSAEKASGFLISSIQVTALTRSPLPRARATTSTGEEGGEESGQSPS